MIVDIQWFAIFMPNNILYPLYFIINIQLVIICSEIRYFLIYR